MIVEHRKIDTDAGYLELIPVTIDQLQGFAHYWPMELFASSDDSSRYGLVFQHGDDEVHGVKMQPVDIAEDEAQTIHHVNRALIASALPEYLEKQHRGVMVPCAYYKKKAEGMAESGIAFFVGPDASSMNDEDPLFDHKLGDGASPMVWDMARAIYAASKETGLPYMRPIGMDLRPRLLIGGLAIHFAIEGSNLFVVKDPLDENELVWEYLVGAGFLSLPYAPMKPSAYERKS
jgi:hypothetical protein